jgi:hypothetical protein
MSTTVDESTTEAPRSTERSFRWRLVPAAFLTTFGVLQILLVVVVLGAVLVGRFFAFKLFDGPNSPELTSRSLGGMACIAGLGLAWIVGGRLVWRKRYLAGLLIAAISYPLGAFGANWMFSSQPKSTPTIPAVDPNAIPQMQPRRMDNLRRRGPPPLASTPSCFDDRVTKSA